MNRLNNKCKSNVKNDYFYLIIVLICSMPLCVHAADQESRFHESPIKLFEATYTAKAKGMIVKGEGDRRLVALENGMLLYQMEVDHFLVSIKEESTFRWQACMPIPTLYQYVRKAIGKNKKKSIEFNWEERKGFYVNKKEKGAFQLDSARIDKIGEHLAIRCKIKSGEKDFILPVADKDGVRMHRYKVEAEEIIASHHQQIKSVKVRRVRKSEESRATTFWLAPDYDYLLVKLRHETENSLYEIMIKHAVMEGQRIDF